MEKRRRFCFSISLICIWLLFVSLPASSFAAIPPPLHPSNTPSPRLTLIVIDRIDFRDLLAANAPTLKRLMNEGAVGLISPRVVGALTSESACVTIGAGTPAVADEQAREAKNVYRDFVYYRGPKPGVSYSAGFPQHEGMSALRRLNRQEATLAHPGLLGTILHQHHMKTGVVGAYDRSPAVIFWGQIATISADESGHIDTGSMGEVDLPKDVEGDLKDANLRVVFLSVTMVAATQKSHRATLDALHRADLWLSKWLKLIDLRRERVMIVTPCPRTNKKYFPRLAPVIMVGKGVQRGVLTSPSTRQRGLVTLADIAPTVLEYFNIPKGQRMVGQAMTVVPSENPIAALQRLDEWIAGRNQAVAPVAVLITVWQVVAVVAALVAMMRKGDFSHSPILPFPHSPALSFLLLGAVAIPLSALLVSPLAAWGTAAVVALTLALTCALAGVFLLTPDALSSLRWLTAFAYLGLIVDALINGRLAAASILGNSFATGTRFYGVGNEYAGYLIATALITAGLSSFLEEKSWRPWVWAFPLTFILGCAGWGANFGGASTAAVACTVAVVKARSKRFEWQQLLLVMILATVAIAAVVGWEWLNAPESQSHIGRTLSHADGGSLLQIAKRKLQMGWYVIRYTPFNYPLLLAIPVIASVLHWRRGRLKAALAQHRAFDACMVAGVVGSIVALILNDSGIVMAGTMLGTLVPALMFILQNVRCPISNVQAKESAQIG